MVHDYMYTERTDQKNLTVQLLHTPFQVQRITLKWKYTVSSYIMIKDLVSYYITSPNQLSKSKKGTRGGGIERDQGPLWWKYLRDERTRSFRPIKHEFTCTSTALHLQYTSHSTLHCSFRNSIKIYKHGINLIALCTWELEGPGFGPDIIDNHHFHLHITTIKWIQWSRLTGNTWQLKSLHQYAIH